MSREVTSLDSPAADEFFIDKIGGGRLATERDRTPATNVTPSRVPSFARSGRVMPILRGDAPVLAPDAPAIMPRHTR